MAAIQPTYWVSSQGIYNEKPGGVTTVPVRLVQKILEAKDPGVPLMDFSELKPGSKEKIIGRCNFEERVRTVGFLFDGEEDMDSVILEAPSAVALVHKVKYVFAWKHSFSDAGTAEAARKGKEEASRRRAVESKQAQEEEEARRDRIHEQNQITFNERHRADHNRLSSIEVAIRSLQYEVLQSESYPDRGYTERLEAASQVEKLREEKAAIEKRIEASRKEFGFAEDSCVLS